VTLRQLLAELLHACAVTINDCQGSKIVQTSRRLKRVTTQKVNDTYTPSSTAWNGQCLRALLRGRLHGRRRPARPCVATS
jgi:hypothetical protein